MNKQYNNMKTFLEYLNESQRLLKEGGASGHMTHLFEDPTLSFKKLKDIFTKVFTGKIEVSEKTDGQNLNVTCIDGKLKAARNKTTLKAPMDIKELANKFEGRGPLKDAFVNSMKDLQTAIESLTEEEQNEIFNNGKNFMAFEIIYPPTKNVVDYGNRCLIQFHGINIYNDNWEKETEDKEAASKLYSMLKAKDALKQNVFEITGPAILRCKNAKSADASLAAALNRLSKVQGDLPDNTSIDKYVKIQYAKHIFSAINEVGLNVAKKDKLAKDLANVLGDISIKSPSKTTITSILKKYKIDATIAKDFMNKLVETTPETRQRIIKPLEMVVIYAGLRLMKNLIGYISTDPKETSKKMAEDLAITINELSRNESKLDSSVLARFKNNLTKLDEFKRQTSPAEGIVFLYKGKVYKMTGTFGAINQLSGIFKFG